MRIMKTFEGYSDINIDLEEKETKPVIEFLNKLLSNHFILMVKAFNFHWNMVGKDFAQAHKFFQDIYEGAFEKIDSIAERVRFLGGRPISTVKGYLDEADLKDCEDDITDIEEMYELILKDIEDTIVSIRKFLKEEDVDNGTTNFLEGLLDETEKVAWLTRSHIKD